jgi:hypothetical protein
MIKWRGGQGKGGEGREGKEGRGGEGRGEREGMGWDGGEPPPENKSWLRPWQRNFSKRIPSLSHLTYFERLDLLNLEPRNSVDLDST